MAELLSITHLKPGDKAPAFNALDQDGNKVSSAGLKGQRYALYFYPNDDTETCTKQACNLRDNYAALKKAGIKIGAIIREELVPAHELAVSTLIGPSVARFEVDKETALQYLRRDEIKIETEYKGWALVTFRALPIGWVKVLANRINNHYPAPWRILNR